MAKRLFCVVMGLFVLLFMSGAALAADQAAGKAKCPGGGKSLGGTTWTGDFTFIASDGTTATATGVTLTILAQTGNLINGTTPDPNNSANTIAFSGVVGYFGADNLLMTAPDYIAFGDFARHHKAMKLIIRGSSTATGGSFYGELTKQ
jgi:hypothetical protein